VTENRHGGRAPPLWWKLVIISPSLDETLARSSKRDKTVLKEHTRTQHARWAEWDAVRRINPTGLNLEQSSLSFLSGSRSRSATAILAGQIFSSSILL
jgi:hypothetical protein